MKLKNKSISFLLLVIMLIGLSPHQIEVNAAEVTIQGPVVYYKHTDIPKNIVVGNVPYTLIKKVHKTGKTPCMTFKQRDFCNWVTDYPTPKMRFKRAEGWEWHTPTCNIVDVTIGSRTYKVRGEVQVHRLETHCMYYAPKNMLTPAPYNGVERDVNLRGEDFYMDPAYDYNGKLSKVRVIQDHQWGDMNFGGGGAPILNSTYEYYTAWHLYQRWVTYDVYYGVYKVNESHPSLIADSVHEHVYAKDNIYWYKKGGKFIKAQTQQVYRDPYVNIERVYCLLKDTSNGKIVVSTGTNDAAWRSWDDVKDSSVVTYTNGTKIDGSGRQIRTRFVFDINKPGIYSIFTSARNKSLYWQLPSKSQGSPIDTKKKIGVDEAGPTGNISIGDSDLVEVPVDITNINDFADSNSSIEGSGFKYVKVALFPVTGSSYKGSDIWTNGVYDPITNKAHVNVKYSGMFANIYGDYNLDVYMYDNVGNVSSKRFIVNRNDDVKSSGTISVQDRAISNIPSSEILTGSVKNGKYRLKVQAIANAVPLQIPNYSDTNSDGILEIVGYKTFFPSIYFTGSGRHVSSPISTTQVTMNETRYYLDDINTAEAPTLTYNRIDTDSKVSWNQLKDLTQTYNFYLNADKNSRKELKCLDSGTVKFASGYNYHKIVLYKATGDHGETIGSPLYNNTAPITNFSMNKYRTGWYKMEVTMYDRNDNPSGTGVLWFYHDQPALYSPFDFNVGAVKDVDWEGIGSIHYGETDSPSLWKETDQVTYFPLGESSTADVTTLLPNRNGNNIAKGYAIHYDIAKENHDELDDLYVEYKFYTTSGKPLALYQNGKILNQVDMAEGTEFTKRRFSKSELSEVNDGKRFYISHFLPVNFTAKIRSTGEEYVGDVRVRLLFHSKINGVSAPIQSIDVYTVDMTKTALDDLELDKDS